MTIQAQTLFDELQQYVKQARTVISGGSPIDLEGLDQRIDTLCQLVLKLNDAEREAYKDKLAALLSDLQSLGDSLSSEKNKIAGQLTNITSHRKATVAYAKTEASDLKKPSDSDN